MTKLADLLVDTWVAVPLESTTLEETLRSILLRVHRAGLLSEEAALELGSALAEGGAGELHALNDQVVAVLGTVEALEGPSVALAVVPEPLETDGVRDGMPDAARAVLVVLAPESLNKVRKELLPELVRALRDPTRTERLLAAGSVAEIRGMRELMDVTFQTRMLVEDALVPVQYRVYPDTPLAEVMDLIVRRGIRAIPVVGEQYEVLGILTSGDALGHLVHKGRPQEASSDGEEAESADLPRARDIMARTVLCVSEDQGLLDAANMMVNRDVEQLPVVRDGELVGFVTRDSILRALYDTRSAKSDDENENDREP